MTEITIQIKNISQIRKAFKQSPALMAKELNTAIRKSILTVDRKAVMNAPVKTGRLRSSRYTSFGFLSGEIGFKANYAAAVHDGTKPHIIRPKFKRALWWKGAQNPVTRVNHPGTIANPYLKKAVDSSDREIDQNFKTAVSDVMDKIGKDSG